MIMYIAGFKIFDWFLTQARGSKVNEGTKLFTTKTGEEVEHNYTW